MKILFAGGGTGGHFYPIIAVARQLRRIAEEERFFAFEFIFASDNPIDKALLEFEEIRYKEIPTGKIRNYASGRNVSDMLKTFFAVIRAFFFMYNEMPDVVFGKGGYASFPVLLAARLLGIPVIIHESDAVPGKVSNWAKKFARRIAISFPEVAEYFPKDRTALIGNPIRTQLLGGNRDESRVVYGLEDKTPTILVIGGSQGARSINNMLLGALPQILERAQVIHQCGDANFEDVIKQASVILQNSPKKSRYHIFPFLDEDRLRSAAIGSDIVISRAGGTAIFEIAAWGLPSIIIPLPLAAQNHQRANAYSYARSGACEVIEETNLTPYVLFTEISKLLDNQARVTEMKKAAQGFARLDAAEKLAREIIKLGLHE
ncbi:MAG: undecaprenyldiphospho-muramoylpentapeptide beta-N-acetylglucosaminyltransferase [Candidatus Ryanbacteria bacterium RIFCSPHIGHO2_02_FULL_48_12]|uniref:UDP-N-acetylglucosamine--N-acetylmuramyl-(pentapeptide) pyrophosphoryl-undecaprenol N-acetylglucosamine transferase n=1 Tax=Candidatus Ryanbacteria bacterium RIFCSPHIGHO2_01_FULL_48_27 TaxID=1802115 RepID=A0A1G2G433_9BACT|nr:MAG: undecaprenyldiphospho-muramoylpentapeptide beta-N-acetylglucosaminyltransferase [Candidatus Ryanbacteria bacterium RIFCSPHIGHO2_01_FULL_48_27]OGZ49262.1 MAG: undecaprenyldiphospho-muramoylpentapeptide beta-N-acetylglucosaminyltransferase [Candidatus Ryanbacteria bacterium RIFCSPHIGHO2_02_FULL_48_12]